MPFHCGMTSKTPTGTWKRNMFRQSTFKKNVLLFPLLGTLRMLKALGNITREMGDSIKLRCEVSGDPAPSRFRWYKNEAPVLEEKGRVVVRKYRTGSSIHGSRLRIVDVDTHDTGYYKCEASNGVDRVESTGIVIVRMSTFSLIISYLRAIVLSPFHFLGANLAQPGPLPGAPSFPSSFPSLGSVPLK